MVGDASQLNELYDQSGDVPLIGDPVGLALDQSQGAELGAELITNGGFDDATGWVLQANWAISGGVASASGAGNDAIEWRNAGLEEDAFYEVALTISNYSLGNLGVQCGAAGTTSERISGNGTFRVILRASVVNTEIYDRLRIAGYSSFTADIDNVSVKKLKGNHATQPVSSPCRRMEWDYGVGRPVWHLRDDGDPGGRDALLRRHWV